MLRSPSLPFAVTLFALTLAVGVFASRVEAPWMTAAAQNIPRPAPSDRIFLKLEGVDGEVTEADHTKEIAVQSFLWSESRSVDSSSKVQMKDFHVVTALDASSPLLMRKTAARERIPKATLTIRSSWGQDYAKWTLSDVIVTSFQVEETSGQTKPKVSFTLNFAKIDMEYRPQLNTGALGPAVKAGWDTKGG